MGKCWKQALSSGFGPIDLARIFHATGTMMFAESRKPALILASRPDQAHMPLPLPVQSVTLDKAGSHP